MTSNINAAWDHACGSKMSKLRNIFLSNCYAYTNFTNTNSRARSLVVSGLGLENKVLLLPMCRGALPVVINRLSVCEAGESVSEALKRCTPPIPSPAVL